MEYKRKDRKHDTANTIQQKRKAENNTLRLEDNRPEATIQQKQVDNMNKQDSQQPVQKKKNNTGLPDNLKSGIESLSGHTMDDVKVHYNSSKPAQLSAHAYAQGTNIHLSSGQERHLPHEAWHVVQQKQGRVRPTMQMNDKHINDDNGLENEADIMGAKALQLKSHDSATTKTVSNSPIVQRKKWWEFWKKEEEPDPYSHLSESDQRLARMGDRINRAEYGHNRNKNVIGGSSFNHATSDDMYRNARLGQQYHERSGQATETPTSKTVAEKVGLGSSIVSKTGTILTQAGQIAGNDSIGTAGRITGAVGATAGVGASLLDAGLGIHDIATSKEKKKDKAIKSIDVLGALANASNAGASGVSQIAGLVGSSTGTAATLAGKIAAPAAIAKGGADVVSGLATGGLAHYRSNKLAKIENDGFRNDGIARFAKENQWTKAKANYGKAAGGALGIAGGATLLAAGLSNPVGWGLLVGAGLVGAGLAGYKMIKKHQQGKQLDKSEYKDQLYKGGINVPTDEEMGKGGWSDIFKTKSMRRRDMVRGQIGMKLAENESKTGFYDTPDGELSDIGEHLGVKKHKGEGISLMDDLESGGREEDKMKRAKAYAKGLDY